MRRNSRKIRIFVGVVICILSGLLFHYTDFLIFIVLATIALFYVAYQLGPENEDYGDKLEGLYNNVKTLDKHKRIDSIEEIQSDQIKSDCMQLIENLLAKATTVKKLEFNLRVTNQDLQLENPDSFTSEYNVFEESLDMSKYSFIAQIRLENSYIRVYKRLGLFSNPYYQDNIEPQLDKRTLKEIENAKYDRLKPEDVIKVIEYKDKPEVKFLESKTEHPSSIISFSKVKIYDDRDLWEDIEFDKIAERLFAEEGFDKEDLMFLIADEVREILPQGHVIYESHVGSPLHWMQHDETINRKDDLMEVAMLGVNGLVGFDWVDAGIIYITYDLTSKEYRAFMQFS